MAQPATVPASEYVDIASVWATAENLDEPDVLEALGFEVN